MDANLRSLFGKLTPATRAATEAAAGLCVARSHYNIEIEHYVFKLLDASDGDFAAIAKHAEWKVSSSQKPFDPADLRTHAAEVKRVAGQRFWNDKTGRFVSASTRGFIGGYPYSRHTISVVPIAGRGNMIAALRRLQGTQELVDTRQEQLATLKIAGARMNMLMATHPPLADRIAALESLRG